MAYSGRVEQLFHRALLHAFDRATLEQFVVVNLDIELENVTRRGNFSDEVWDLVRWADRNDRLPELFQKAAAEVPANPHLREAVKQLQDPELVEDRWHAKFIPLTTWLVWIANLWLLIAVVKVWMVNLIDLSRLTLTVGLGVVVAGLVWLLYQRLVGGPIRSFAGLLLLRRLIAHSRLGTRDWLAFAGTLVAAVGLGTLVGAAPKPLDLSFESQNIGGLWRGMEFSLVGQFPTSEMMELQNPEPEGLELPQRFSPTYYRVDLYTGARNSPREITVQIELIPPDARDLDDPRAQLPTGVTFADVAFDRGLAGVLDGQGRGAGDQQRLSVYERSITFTLPLDQLKGFHTVLFTCQRALDAQPSASEVAVYAQLKDSKAGAVLSSDRAIFQIAQWKASTTARHGDTNSDGGRSVRRIGRSDVYASSRRNTPFHLPFGRPFAT